MSTEDFKTKAAACRDEFDAVELCLAYLRYQAKSENASIALKALVIFEEIML